MLLKQKLATSELAAAITRGGDGLPGQTGGRGWEWGQKGD